MIALLKKLPALVYGVAGLAICGIIFVLGWQVSSYSKKAAESAQIAAERANTIEVLEEQLRQQQKIIALHDEETAALAAQQKKNLAYYADLKSQIDKFAAFAESHPDENLDPIYPADLVRLRNDAKDGL